MLLLRKLTRDPAIHWMGVDSDIFLHPGAVLIWRSDYSAMCTNGSGRSVAISGASLMSSLESNPLFLPDHVYELRVPKTRQGTVSGYFDDLKALYRAAQELDGKVPGLYVTMNPTNPALLARAKNRIQLHAKVTTSDTDILRRVWLLIDCDPVRPADISSNESEHQAALERCHTIAHWLTSLGWPEPVTADKAVTAAICCIELACTTMPPAGIRQSRA